jgi:hypothetical protein
LVSSCAGDRACQTCHHWPEQELRDRVEQIQTRFYDTRQIAMDALVDLIHDIKAAKDAGATDAELQNAWQHSAKAGSALTFWYPKTPWASMPISIRPLRLPKPSTHAGKASWPCDAT